MIRIFLIFIFLTPVFYASDIKSYIEQNLPTQGILEQTKNGFVYVKVPDDYIYELYKFIHNEDYLFPPYFGENLVGAHISVIHSKEAPQEAIEELGLVVTFEIMELKKIYLQTMLGVESAYILTIHAPILDAIRKKYGLSSPYYPYHITVGVK
jgi:hypothetical protein